MMKMTNDDGEDNDVSVAGCADEHITSPVSA